MCSMQKVPVSQGPGGQTGGHGLFKMFSLMRHNLHFLMGMLDSCRNQGKKQAGNSASLPETSPVGHCEVKPERPCPTFIHVLGDNVDGLLGHHGVQLDQLVVL